MKKDPFKIITVLVLAVGIIGSLFSFGVFIFGGKAEAVVTQIQHNRSNTVATYSYSYDGEQYTKEQRYKRNKKISDGDTRKVYFFKKDPSKAFTMSTFAVFYFLVILMGPIAYVLFKRR